MNVAAAAEAPNWTDVMQAWGTVASALLSSIAVLITGLLLRHERKARRLADEESRSSQARSVWLEITSVVGNPSQGFLGFEWRVHNGSNLPISWAHIKVYEAWTEESLPGNCEPDKFGITGGSARDGSYTFNEVQSWSPGLEKVVEAADTFPGTFDPKLIFTDSAGEEWQRFHGMDLSHPSHRAPSALSLLLAEYLGIRRLKDTGRRLQKSFENSLRKRLSKRWRRRQAKNRQA